MAGTYDITIDQGTDFNMVFTWTTGSPGTPVDLTGYHAHLQIKSAYASQGGLIYVDLSDTGGGITLGGTAGTIQVTMTNAATSALTFAGAAVYDLKLTSPGGLVTRLMQGTVLLSLEVTI